MSGDAQGAEPVRVRAHHNENTGARPYSAALHDHKFKLGPALTLNPETRTFFDDGATLP